MLTYTAVLWNMKIIWSVIMLTFNNIINNWATIKNEAFYFKTRREQKDDTEFQSNIVVD